MRQKFLLLLLAAGMLLGTASCQRQRSQPEEESGTPSVELTVWSAAEDEALLEQIFDSFRQHYAGQADLHITYQAQSESNCKDVLLGGLEEGADVFAFADDQVAALAAAGGLDPVENAPEIAAANLSASVEAASVDRSEEHTSELQSP